MGAARFMEWNGSALVPLNITEVAAPPTVRKNWALNPQALTPGTGFGAYTTSNEVGTTTWVTGATDGPLSTVTRYGRRTVTTAKTNASSTGWGLPVANKAPLAGGVGDLVSVAVWIRYTGPDATTTGIMRTYLANDAGANVTIQDAAPITLPSGAWVRVYGSATATAAFTGVTWWFFQAPAVIVPATSTVDATGLEVEGGTLTAGLYVDGDAADVPGVVAYDWTGAAGASPSTETWARKVLRMNLSPNPSAEVSTAGFTTGGSAVVTRDTAWADPDGGGVASFKIAPVAASVASTAAYPYALNSAMHRMGVLPGRTYTFGATIRMTGAQTGTLDSGARRITIGSTVNNVTNFQYAMSPAAPNAAGVTRLAVTFTVPVDATNMFVRLMHGERGTDSGGTGNPVWWDRLSLVEGTVDSYFDGDAADTSGAIYDWAGAAGLSPSVEQDARGGTLTAWIV